MAGALTISTLNNDTGVLATQNGMTGIAKAWVNFSNSGAVVVNGSFNVSSVTNIGTGQYTVSFTTAMPTSNYTYSGSGTDGVNAFFLKPNTATTGSFTGTFGNTTTNFNVVAGTMVFHGA